MSTFSSASRWLSVLMMVLVLGLMVAPATAQDAPAEMAEKVEEVAEEAAETVEEVVEAFSSITTVKTVFDKEAIMADLKEAIGDDDEASLPFSATREYSDGTSTPIMLVGTLTKDGEFSYASTDLTFELWTINNLWVMIAAALVFIMHLGFACLESGFARSKNTVNILFKNTLIPCIGLITYAFIGFNLMYPGDFNIIGGGILGLAMGDLGPIADGSGAANNSPMYYEGYTYYTDFIFQGMFAATAATIVSGAVVERIKLIPFLIFSTIFVGLVYPWLGSWHWGGGWAAEMGFYDFAGSTLVHSVGGWGALVGAIILGPRLGKFNEDGSANAIPGHSMPIATIGVFLLWLGWFGFNGGSVLSADAASVSRVFTTTALAASAGCIGAFIACIVILRSFDLSMVLNGILAGLVGITAGADQMYEISSMFIGLVCGIVVVPSVMMFEKLKIDDPVGATSVHLVCGILGTLFVGIVGDSAGGEQLVTQAIVIAGYAVGTIIPAAILFFVLKVVCGIRVSKEEEVEGLDLGEHDMAAYPDFQMTNIKSYHLREL